MAEDSAGETGLITEDITMDPLDIHHDQRGVKNKVVQRTEEETDSALDEQGGFTTPNKKKRKPNKAKSDGGATSDGPVNKVVLLKFLEESNIKKSNPDEITKLLNNSPFHKYF